MRPGKLVNFWIFQTSAEHWEQVKAHNVYAFAREADRDKLQPGDKGVFYLIRSEPPVFVGVCEVGSSWEEAKEPFWAQEKVDGRVIWPWQFRVILLRSGAVDARNLIKNLSFIENKKVWSVYLMGPMGNFARPIPERDFQLIFVELLKPAVAYEIKAVPRPEIAPVTKVPRRLRIPQLRGPPPAHNELRDMIRDIGLMKKFVAETEYPINDLRLDVAWRTEVQKMPSRVWEVHIRGNFYEALAKLKHAWDYWRAEPFLVTTEKYEEEARSLLGGTFHEIKPHIRIIHWQDIVQLYKLLREVTETEKELRL